MAEKEMIRGTGNTCIFSHNLHLSQCMLEGKHPSLPIYWMPNLYINFSSKMAKKIIRVRAEPPFLHLRPGLDINRSRRRPFTLCNMPGLYKKLSAGNDIQGWLSLWKKIWDFWAECLLAGSGISELIGRIFQNKMALVLGRDFQNWEDGEQWLN